jgi:hypothetical protein
MRLRLIPREEKFFADLVTLADRIVSAAARSQAVLRPAGWGYRTADRHIEHECDAITHEVIQRLNRTFLTPLACPLQHRLRRPNETT